MYVAYGYQHVTVSMHYLPTTMCTFNSLMQQNACYHDLKSTFEGLLPCYCYAIKTNSRTIRSRLSQPTSAGKGRYMSLLLSFERVLLLSTASPPRYQGRCWAAIRLSHRPERSGSVVRGGGRWIGHWRTTWSTVCSAPHSQAAEEAIPHL